MDVVYWVIVVLCSTPLYFLSGWAIFDSWAGVVESVKYAIKPDIVSWIQGEGVDDAWNELKLFIYLALCAGITFLVHWVAQTYIL